nr:hypothetical protein [Moritella viscosa]SHN97602.1 Putative uncharacterized protein [Moritella viscosa]
MELIYLWTAEYKNLKGDYHLSSNFKVENTKKEFIITDSGTGENCFFSPNNNIQISTIIGSNGSGKSNILKKILHILYNESNKSISSNDILILKIDNEIQYLGSSNATVIYKNKIIKKTKCELFTIYFNYMIDSLKDKGSDDWINNIFHKSDNYNTPVLIEPFKKNGIIDMSNI